MADIRQTDSDQILGMGKPCANSPLARAGSRSSDRLAAIIAVEKKAAEYNASLKEQVISKNLPEWVIRYESERNVDSIKIIQRNNNTLFFRDSLGCMVDLPREAIPFYQDGITLVDLINLAKS